MEIRADFHHCKKDSNAEVSYFYTRNLQGDIIAIYRNSDSKLIGTYEYDLWGRLVSETEIKGIDTNGILAKNPFRYRGYYYDTETGFYYLNARYYDPEVRRFISADDMEYLGVGDGISGYNLFAYCGNNPVMGYDPTGNWDWGGFIVGAGIIGVGAAVAIGGGPLTLAATAAIGYVIGIGIITCYAAATDSAMVVDMSGAVGVPVYGKGGMSAVIDFGNDNINVYGHLGGGIGFQCGPSVAVGLVDNYEKPDDYKGPFIGGNAAFWLGGDYCWDPREEYDLATKARSVTFSSGPSYGFGYDRFWDPIQIFEW